MALIPQRLLSHVQHTFEHSLDGVYVKDDNFLYYYMNQTSLNNLELKRDDVLSNSDSDLCFSEFAMIYNQHDQLAIQGRIFFQVDKSISKKGKQLFVLSQKLPLKDEQGNVHGTLGFSKYMDMVQLLAFINSNRGVQLDIPLTFNLQELMLPHLGLTKRELDVLYYILQGFLTKRIANILKITEKTVTFHINNIKSKWQCVSKEDIYCKAHQHQLINLTAIWDGLLKEESK